MKLTKEEIALLDKDPKVFLARAYKLHYPEKSTREVAKKVGLSHTKVHQIFTAEFTAGFTAKPARGKGEHVGAFTAEFTPQFTDRPDKEVKVNPTLASRMKPIFDIAFMEVSSGMPFVWSAKEMKRLKELGKQIAFSLKSKGRPCDDDSVVSAFPSFLSSIRDPWILEHFTPSIISSKYNDIISSYNQRQRSASRADERQRATDALEALRAGASSVQQR